MTDPSPNSPHWLEWYVQLQNDRVRRSLGLNREDEGLMSDSDRLQLKLDRGEIPKLVTFDSVRERMGLEPLRDKEVRKQMGLEE